MALENIRMVSRYEGKFIRRNKLFWIFVVCILVLVISFQWRKQVNWNGFLMNPLLPSMLPYLNAWLFNLLQSLLVIFMGVDFIWRDKRLNTNDVLLAHPVTNMEYQAGKLWGVLRVCLLLAVFTVGFGMLLHVLFVNPVTFRLSIYLFYLVTLIFPTMVFVLGVSFLVASLVNNHALTVLLLVGIFIALYLSSPWMAYGTFDPWGRSLPALFSDAIGLVNPGLYLLHRFAYFICGVGLILFSMSRMRREDDANRVRMLYRVSGVFLFVIGLFAGASYWNTYAGMDARRGEYRIIQKKYTADELVSVVTHDIRYRQSGSEMFGESDLLLRNENERAITPVIYLNPGLKISVLENDSGEIAFRREGHAVILQRELNPGEELPVRMKYNGEIDESICYLELPDEQFHDTRVEDWYWSRHNTFSYGGGYVRVSRDFTLLLPECMWYPMAVPPVNIVEPSSRNYDFTRYTLNVENPGGKAVISQGERETNGTSVRFTSQTPLPRLSLCIGNYERRSIQIDSVLLEAYVFPGRDHFFDEYKTHGDSLVMLFRGMFADYKSTFLEDYPNRKLSMVEMPLNFRTYKRANFDASNYVQPEVFFQPERLFTSYYKGVAKIEDQYKGLSMNFSRFDIEHSALSSFVSNFKHSPLYSLKPMYTDFRSIVYSSRFPGIGDLLVDIRDSDGMASVAATNIRSMDMVSRAAKYWNGRSLREAFYDGDILPTDQTMYMRLKRYQMYAYLFSQINQDSLRTFAREFIARHAYRRVNFDLFNREVKECLGVELEPLLDYYYDLRELPAMLVNDVKVEKMEKGGKMFASFKVYNPTDVDGVLMFRGATSYKIRSSPKMIYEYYLIPAHACKEIRTLQVVSNLFEVSFGLAHNIPNDCQVNLNMFEMDITTDERMGIWDTDSSGFILPKNEIVVDNEDEGFRLIQKTEREKLGKRFAKDKKKEYTLIMQNKKWTLVANSVCHGRYVKSAYYKVAGSGEEKAEWTVNIPKAGRYKVYAFVPDYDAHGVNGARLPGSRLYYEVASRAGVKEVEINADDEEAGWVLLGSYEFDEGAYTVLMSDKGGTEITPLPGQMVYSDMPCVQIVFADAVKWVPE